MRKGNRLSVRRRTQDGWTDYYFGNTAEIDPQRHSVLSAQGKVGLHYYPADLRAIKAMGCPSDEIPADLWQQLINQGSRSQRILHY